MMRDLVCAPRKRRYGKPVPPLRLEISLREDANWWDETARCGSFAYDVFFIQASDGGLIVRDVVTQAGDAAENSHLVKGLGVA